MSGSKSSEPTNHQAGANSPNEIALEESPNAGTSKRKTAAIAGTTSATAAICAALATYYLSGGTLIETPQPCKHYSVDQQSTLTFSGDRLRRQGTASRRAPAPPRPRSIEDTRTPLQKSCDEFNALTAWKTKNKINHAANLPQDSPAPTVPAARRTTRDTFRDRHVGRRGSSGLRSNLDDDLDDPPTKRTGVLRSLFRRD